MGAYLEALDKGRCNNWRLRVDVWEDGRRRRFSKRFEGRKRDALAALRDYEAECLAAPVYAATLPDYTRELSRQRLAAGLISDNTHQQYLWAARVFDCVLDISLADVTPDSVRAALARIGQGCTPSGRPLSEKSAANLIKCGRVVLDEAMRADLAGSNAFRGVTVAPGNKERRSLDVAGAAGLLDALGHDSAGAFAASLILRSGLRASEALGLVWDDLEEGGLIVRREITKTAAGVRFVPLSEKDLEYIELRRRYLVRVHAKAGGRLSDSDRLCSQNDGRPLSYNALRLWWARHRDALGVGGFTLHELRHTYLTNLAQAGVHPSVMQRLAGHSSARVTLDIYTHAKNDDLRAAVDALDDLRGGGFGGGFGGVL